MIDFYVDIRCDICGTETSLDIEFDDLLLNIQNFSISEIDYPQLDGWYINIDDNTSYCSICNIEDVFE